MIFLSIEKAQYLLNRPSILQIKNLYRFDGKRPDGMTIFFGMKESAPSGTRRVSICLLPFNLNDAPSITGGAATVAEGMKMKKYLELIKSHVFIPS